MIRVLGFLIWVLLTALAATALLSDIKIKPALWKSTPLTQSETLDT